jgi:hypothetical protein
LRFLLAILLLWCNSAWATDYCASAVGCWLFREGTGTTVEDSSPNTNTGTFASSGNPAWVSTSLPASYVVSSVDFAANNSKYISCGNSSTLGFTTGDFSISYWVKVTSNSGNNVLFSRGLNSTDGYYVQLIGSDTGLVMNSPSVKATKTLDIPANNTWAHYVMVRNGATGYIYKNGTEVASYNLREVASPSASTRNFYMGRYDSSGFPLAGQLTEVGVFATALNSTDANAIYNLGLSPSASTPLNSIFTNFTGSNFIWKKN